MFPFLSLSWDKTSYKRNADWCFVDTFTSVFQDWKEIVTHLHNKKERGGEQGKKIYRYFDLDFFLVIIILSVIVISNKHIKQWKSQGNITERQNLSVCSQ